MDFLPGAEYLGDLRGPVAGRERASHDLGLANEAVAGLRSAEHRLEPIGYSRSQAVGHRPSNCRPAGFASTGAHGQCDPEPENWLPGCDCRSGQPAIDLHGPSLPGSMEAQAQWSMERKRNDRSDQLSGGSDESSNHTLLCPTSAPAIRDSIHDVHTPTAVLGRSILGSGRKASARIDNLNPDPSLEMLDPKVDDVSWDEVRMLEAVGDQLADQELEVLEQRLRQCVNEILEGVPVPRRSASIQAPTSLG
jgi:hypothetical protein